MTDGLDSKIIESASGAASSRCVTISPRARFPQENMSPDSAERGLLLIGEYSWRVMWPAVSVRLPSNRGWTCVFDFPRNESAFAMNNYQWRAFTATRFTARLHGPGSTFGRPASNFRKRARQIRPLCGCREQEDTHEEHRR